MGDLLDRRARVWAVFALVAGVGLLLGLEMYEEPEATALDLVLELVDILPIVLTSVGVVLLFRVTSRQREENIKVIRDLELARAQGQRWRSEARTYLNGLGEAIEKQFMRWSLTEAEREVALLLLKGLTHQEVAAVRNVSERTVREQSRAIYSKSGLSGRVALSAFFLEDLLAPVEGVE